MCHHKASRQRAEFIADATALFHRAKREGRVTVDNRGRCKWRDHFEQQRWEDIHASADLVIKRFYEAERGPF